MRIDSKTLLYYFTRMMILLPFFLLRVRKIDLKATEA